MQDKERAGPGEIIYAIVWSVAPGKTDEFKMLANEAVEIARRKSRVATYKWYFSEDGSRCGLIEKYPDGSAMRPHLEEVGGVLSRMLRISKISRFDVFGALEGEEKADVDKLGGRLFSPYAGFEREETAN